MICKAHGQNHCSLHYQDPIGSPEQKANKAKRRERCKTCRRRIRGPKHRCKRG